MKDHVDSQQLDIYKHEYNSTIREATVPPASGFGKQSVCVGGGDRVGEEQRAGLKEHKPAAAVLTCRLAMCVIAR